MAASRKAKNPVGRPEDYRPEYCQRLVQYFTREPYKTDKKSKKLNPCDFPTFEGFGVKIGSSQKTMLEWCDRHEEFRKAWDICKSIQKEIIVTNGLRGLYHPQFAIFVAKNATDMRDKTVTEHEGLGAFVSRFNSGVDKI